MSCMYAMCQGGTMKYCLDRNNIKNYNNHILRFSEDLNSWYCKECGKLFKEIEWEKMKKENFGDYASVSMATVYYVGYADLTQRNSCKNTEEDLTLET